MDTQANRSGIAGNLWLQMIGLAVVVAALIVLAANRLVKPLRPPAACRRTLGGLNFVGGHTGARWISH